MRKVACMPHAWCGLRCRWKCAGGGGDKIACCGSGERERRAHGDGRYECVSPGRQGRCAGLGLVLLGWVLCSETGQRSSCSSANCRSRSRRMREGSRHAGEPQERQAGRPDEGDGAVRARGMCAGERSQVAWRVGLRRGWRVQCCSMDVGPTHFYTGIPARYSTRWGWYGSRGTRGWPPRCCI